MATFYSTGVGGNYPKRMTLRTVATINSQDPVANKSNVTISAYAYYNYGEYTAPNPTDGGQSLRIDDVRVHSSSKNLDYTGSNSSNQRFLFSWTDDIAHNADGTKTVELKVWQDCPGVTTLDYLSGTHYWTLTTIARASTPTVSAGTVNLGSQVTVYTNRAAGSGFLHAFDYSIGGQNVTIATGVADSFTWTLPLGIADVLPNATSGTVTLTCYTWSGSTHVGTKTVTLTAVVPNNDTFQPSATITSIAEATAAMAGAGVYLTAESTLRVLSSAAKRYSASISQIKIEVAGGVYYGADITTGVIGATGDQEVRLTVTDSRGYSRSHSLWINLKAIAAPTVSAGSAALGSQITIYTNRPAGTSLTHTLTYAIGNQSGAIANGVGDSTPWTLPLTIGAALPNATSGAVTITQKTYNGGNLLETRTVAMTATIPNNAAFQPDAIINSITEGASGLSAFTVRIQGKSKLLIASSATPKYSATITQFKVVVDGGTYYGSFTAGAGTKTASVTTAIIPTTGTVTATLTVTDSRGFTKTAKLDTNVEPYTPPRINAFTASRSPDDSGEDLTAPLNLTISPIANQNTKRYVLRYRPTGGSWTTAVDSTTAYSLTTTYTATGVLDADQSHEVELTVSDYFGSASKTIPIKSGFDLVNYRATGKGIAFGKVSEIDAMEVALPLHALKGISFKDTRSIDDEPQTIPDRAISFDFKSASAVGNPPIKASAIYAHIITVAGWGAAEGSGGWPSQLSIGADGIAVRQATSATAWGPWKAVGGSSALDAYPVGAIYLSATATNPGTIFGGTWAAFGTGRTLVGIDTAQTEFNTVEKTGGHKNLQSHTHSGSSGTTGAHTHTGTAAAGGGHGHTGTAASAGAHTHTIDYQRFYGVSVTTSSDGFDLNRKADASAYGSSAAAQSAGAHTHAITADAVGDHAHTVSVTGAGDHAHTVTVGSAGAGNAENLQPYITVYMWKRTA